MIRINEGFFGREPLDLGDLMVEIVVTLHLLRSLTLINSGPNSVEVLSYLSAECSDNRVFPRLPTLITECFLVLLLSPGLQLCIRLVMSTLSRPTSFSSSPPSPPLARPSSPSSLLSPLQPILCRSRWPTCHSR